MSFGFSAGDFMNGIHVAFRIYDLYFASVSVAQTAYTEYGNQIKLLAESIRSLTEILGHHEKKIQKIQETNGTTLIVDMVDIVVLKEIMGDFDGTLKRTQKLLDKSKFTRNGRGYITRIQWTMSTEEEVKSLTQACQFHIIKIQFVIKPLELKLLMDIRNQIDRVHASLSHQSSQETATVLNQINNVLLLLRNRDSDNENTLELESAETNDSIHPISEVSARFSRLITPNKIVEKFEETIQSHPRYDSMCSEIPMSDWCDAVIWWIEKVKLKLADASEAEATELSTEIYLNILKAAWLLSKVEKTDKFSQLPKDSLWTKCMLELSQSIVKVLGSYSSRGLTIPEEDKLFRLPEDCFILWIINSEEESEKESDLTFNAKRLGEEKIFDESVEPNEEQPRLARTMLVFRKDLDILRLCDITEAVDSGQKTVESFSLKSAETELIALYITRNGPFNVLVRNALHNREYSFRSLSQLHMFQRAIVGWQVSFDSPDQESVVLAPRFGTSIQSAFVRIQIWQDKPSDKIEGTSTARTSGSSYARVPLSPQRMGTFHTTSGSTYNSGGSGHDQEVIEITPREAPRLTVFLKVGKRWMFVQILMEQTLEIKPKRCCGSMGVSSPQVCCMRTVIEDSSGAINSIVFHPEKHDAEWTINLLHATKYSKTPGKKTKFKYVSLKFTSAQEKLRFVRAFHAAKTLQLLYLSKQLQTAQQAVVSRATTWNTPVAVRSFV
ncbi:hypothetical protein EDC01DRAFT_664456 [Geopyxis carbonaria]|nr:hypothetical protein EDC01DRAFT_664456 [Geopyxis carbonaria]